MVREVPSHTMLTSSPETRGTTTAGRGAALEGLSKGTTIQDDGCCFLTVTLCYSRGPTYVRLLPCPPILDDD